MKKIPLINRFIFDLSKIAEFESAFNIKPVEQSNLSEYLDFRRNLLKEEVDELIHAVSVNDPVETMDALCDMRYIMMGTICRIGFLRGALIDNAGQPMPPANALMTTPYSANGYRKSPVDIKSWALIDMMDKLMKRKTIQFSTLLRPYAHLMSIAGDLTDENGLFDVCFTEVHRSNLTKACMSLDEAQKTVEYYTEYKDTEAIIDDSRAINDIWVVRRKSDGKVLKSINYSPAKIDYYLQHYKDLAT